MLAQNLTVEYFCLIEKNCILVGGQGRGWESLEQTPHSEKTLRKDLGDDMLREQRERRMKAVRVR